MKRIEPYRNVEEAMRSLDNGGRFYTTEIKANDGVVNRAELERIGGRADHKKDLILLFQMSISQLGETDKESLFSKLDSEVLQIYKKYKPQELSADDANQKGQLAMNAIITGTPKLIRFDTDLNWLVEFEKVFGNTSTTLITPLIQEYHVYELEDEKTNQSFLIAHKHGTEKLSNKRISLGGIVKELRSTEDGSGEKGKFLEVMYHFRP